MKKNVSRKDFLVNTSKAAVGITAVTSISSLVTTATAKANTKVTPWPWPYQELNADDVRIQAHYLYWNGKDCCSGVFGALVNALSTKIGDPWTNLPMEVMLFGGGGGSGWGVLCGCLNGAAALISTVASKADARNIITELWGWYTQAELPTDTANDFATQNKYLVHNYDQDLPQNVSGSPLCHVSVSEWCILADKKVSDTERKERCARLTGDVAAKTVELLNAYFAGSFTPTYVDPESVAACLGCHGSTAMNNVMTRMDCVDCHGDPHATGNIEVIDPQPKNYKLSQNYPNPFNPSTKIQFSLPKSDKVKLEVYNIQGKLIKTLIDYEVYQPGTYEAIWDGTDMLGQKVASGIYFAKMQAGDFHQTKKMNLVK